ncbi:MAG: hypothetical protein M3011_12715 [Actinomycetota bacterium]|nr:hypothetical protein [Actinomycetota bacterium]
MRRGTMVVAALIVVVAAAGIAGAAWVHHRTTPYERGRQQALAELDRRRGVCSAEGMDYFEPTNECVARGAPSPSQRDIENNTYVGQKASEELGPLNAEIARLHNLGAVVAGDVPFDNPPAHYAWEPSLAGWCRAHSGTVVPITTKAPDISSPPSHVCLPPNGVRFWPPPATTTTSPARGAQPGSEPQGSTPCVDPNVPGGPATRVPEGAACPPGQVVGTG